MNLEQIDTSTTAGKAEVMRLAAEGRRVAMIDPNDLSPKWGINPNPLWNWEAYNYAIISEPVGPEEVWVPVNEIGDVYGAVYYSEDKAFEHAKGRQYPGAAVRYIRADLVGEKG